MHLSAKQFAEILTGLGGDGRDPSFDGRDKRRAPRVQLNNRVTIIPDITGGEAQPVGVEMRDFSSRGLRFLHSQPLPRGGQFVLELPQAGGEPVRILCSVVHSRQTPEGPFSIGAEFTCSLRADKRPQAAASTSASERERIRQSILD
jgi:hypothetical protein